MNLIFIIIKRSCLFELQSNMCFNSFEFIEDLTFNEVSCIHTIIFIRIIQWIFTKHILFHILYMMTISKIVLFFIMNLFKYLDWVKSMIIKYFLEQNNIYQLGDINII